MKQLLFRKELYLGASIDTQKLDKLKKKLAKTPALTKVFLLAISPNPSDQIDIFESKYLTFHYYDEHPLHIIGLAGSNKEAVKLIEQITLECVAERKDADLKAFLLGE